jgi:dipeptidase
MPRPASLLLLCLGLLALQRATDACTTVLVTAGASATGVPMIMHNVDCWDCDNRIALVPSKDHPEGSKYDVYGIGHMYPFLTSEARAWIYRPQPGMVSCHDIKA